MTKYNYNIDATKFLCVIAVVLIHVTAVLPQRGLATLLNYHIYRHSFDIAVPFFFAVSGYFISCKREKVEYVKSYSKKIFTLYLVFSIFYIGVQIMLILMDRIIQNTPFWVEIDKLIKTLSINNFLNGTIGFFHLWYLAALFFSSLILLACIHFQIRPKIIFLLSFIFYLINLLNLLGLESVIIYGGFPKGFFFMSMGYYLGHRSNTLKYPLLLFVVSIALNTLFKIYPTEVKEFFLASATYSLLVFCIQNPGEKSVLSQLGKYTLSVYVLHVLVYRSIYKFYIYFGFTEYYKDVTKMVIVGILSIILPILLYKPINKLFVNPMAKLIEELI